MKARWGSALTDKKTILLNAELIKDPKYCIDYVVLHELVHFKYNDHSEKFLSDAIFIDAGLGEEKGDTR